MDIVLTFSWIGIMLALGVVLRVLIRPLGSILMPASVIGGLIGFVLMNADILPRLGASADGCSQIVSIFFTFSFISMGLTNVPKSEKINTGREAVKGSIGMGCIWNMLYAVQPLVGYGVLLLIGGAFSFSPKYGLLVPFAFDQGPGQSVTFGTQIEKNGLEGAMQVSITFAVIGFLFAFGVGVPIARYGLKHHLACYPEKLGDSIRKGIYKKEEQTQSAGTMTTYNGNIDPLAFCFAMTGLCYGITVPICKLLQQIPNQFAQIFGAMTFFVGMFVAYFVRFILNRLDLKQYIDDGLQNRVTGFTTDFLIAAAFMSVKLSVVGRWLVPILIVSVACAIVTFFFCVFFASRIGGYYDFERFLGIWGCATGTCPSGVALIRIIDPKMRTTASSEMGSMNAVMLVPTFIAPMIISFCADGIRFSTLLLWFAAMFAVSLVGSILTGNVKKKPTFSFVRGEKYLKLPEEDAREDRAS